MDQEELESDLGWMLDSEELVLVLDQEQAQDCQGLLQEGMSTMAPTRPPRESYSIGRCCCHYTPTLLVRMPGRRTTTPHWPCCQSLSRTGQLRGTRGQTKRTEYMPLTIFVLPLVLPGGPKTAIVEKTGNPNAMHD